MRHSECRRCWTVTSLGRGSTFTPHTQQSLRPALAAAAAVPVTNGAKPGTPRAQRLASELQRHSTSSPRSDPTTELSPYAAPSEGLLACRRRRPWCNRLHPGGISADTSNSSVMIGTLTSRAPRYAAARHPAPLRRLQRRSEGPNFAWPTSSRRARCRGHTAEDRAPPFPPLSGSDRSPLQVGGIGAPRCRTDTFSLRPPARVADPAIETAACRFRSASRQAQLA